MQPTTVIDLESGTPVVVRTGRGELARLGLSPS
jgi:tRNA A37 threonylcarbamoyladenosine synthetase subunit TsaC/SUA5/YrdC